MRKRNSALRFPSGRVRWVVASRHALARRICAQREGDWVKLAPEEEDAAQSLQKWGMLDLDEVVTPQRKIVYARWALIHERPRFSAPCVSFTILGKVVHHLTEAQREILAEVMVANALKQPHEMLTLKDRKMRHKLSALERRRLLRIERRVNGVWRLWLTGNT